MQYTLATVQDRLHPIGVIQETCTTDEDLLMSRRPLMSEEIRWEMCKIAMDICKHQLTSKHICRIG